MFLDDIEEVLDDRLMVDSDNEAMSNLRMFSIPQAEAATLRVEQVVECVETVLRSRSKQLYERFGDRHPMLFYCWFDEQAGQLRLSAVSDRDGRLPFGCRLNRVETLEGIVRRFLSHPYHDGIPLSILRDSSSQDSEDDIQENFVLDIWVQSIPTAA